MDLLILAACLFFAFWWQAMQVKLPLHPDTGLFIYRGVMEKEGISLEPKLFIKPDRDYFCAEGYFPTQSKDIIYHLFRLWRKFTSGDIKTYRYYYAVYNLFTVLMLYITASCYLNTTAGLIAAWIYAVYSASPFADTAQLHAENYANLLILAALFFSWQGLQHQSLLMIYLAGMVMGFLVISFKITYLFETLALWLAFIILPPHYSLAGAYSLGFVSFIVLMLAYYLRKGWWQFFWAWCNPRRLWHYRKVPARNYGTQPAVRIKNLLERKYLVFAAQTGFLWFGLLACLYCNFAKFFTAPGIFLGCLLIGSFFNIVVQGKYYSSHFLAALPVISIISAWGLISIIQEPASIYNSAAITVGTLLLIISLQQLAGYLFRYNPLEFFLKFYHLLRHDHILAFLAAEVIASYIQERTVAQDKILMLGYNAELFGLARRRAALGRLEFPLCIDPVINDRYIGPEWQDWLVESIRRDRPKYIADLDGSLDLEALCSASGLTYRLERLFYGLFPLYALTLEDCPRENRQPAPAGIINLEAACKQKQVNLARWFLEQPFSKKSQNYPDAIKDLCQDWCALNKVALAQ